MKVCCCNNCKKFATFIVDQFHFLFCYMVTESFQQEAFTPITIVLTFCEQADDVRYALLCQNMQRSLSSISWCHASFVLGFTH